MVRKLVAVFCHLPGLRLFYGIRPDRALLRRNALAAAATLIAMAMAGFLAPAGAGAIAVLAVWSAGHLAWGLFLVRWPGIV